MPQVPRRHPWIATASLSLLVTSCMGTIGPTDSGEERGPGATGAGKTTGGAATPGAPGMGVPGGPPGPGTSLGPGAMTGRLPPAAGPDAPPGPQPAPGTVSVPSAPVPGLELASRTGLRRLTVDEYDATLRDLIGDDTRPSRLLLPDDPRIPFDNDYTQQVASKALVEGLELLVSDAAARLFKDPARRDRIVGCRPTGPTDEACLRKFVTAFGRRALRRPLTADEVARFAGLVSLGQQANDFWFGARAVLEAFLQHPELLYRVEIGKPVTGQPGLATLGSFELAARLSFLLWGGPPDDALLDKAASGGLATADGVRATAAGLLKDPRARARATRFLALWFGYEELKHDATLSAAMQAETAALVERVLFTDRRPFQDLIRLDETFVGDTMARHYGLPSPGRDARWTKYGASGRRGLLAHGSFLSIGAKAMDTSPTLRGLAIRERLFCEEVPPPPPNVNTDDVIEAANGSPCKVDRYAAHGQGGCASCHLLMDPVGFGLENYDRAGKYRTTEEKLPQCAIAGRGELAGVGAFKGPLELGDLLLRTGKLNGCTSKHLVRFAVGRSHLDEVDERLVSALTARIGKEDFRFDDLLVDFVASPAFAHRREEP